MVLRGSYRCGNEAIVIHYHVINKRFNTLWKKKKKKVIPPMGCAPSCPRRILVFGRVFPGIWKVPRNVPARTQLFLSASAIFVQAHGSQAIWGRPLPAPPQFLWGCCLQSCDSHHFPIESWERRRLPRPCAPGPWIACLNPESLSFVKQLLHWFFIFHQELEVTIFSSG